jgi:hypothetical protein
MVSTPWTWWPRVKVGTFALAALAVFACGGRTNPEGARDDGGREAGSAAGGGAYDAPPAEDATSGDGPGLQVQADGDGGDNSAADGPVLDRMVLATDGEAGLGLDPYREGGLPLPTVYTLNQRRSLASPLPNATGITCDGQELWISARNTLVRFNPDLATTDRTFTLGIPAVPGTGTFGIAWDGQAIWISTRTEAPSRRSKSVLRASLEISL